MQNIKYSQCKIRMPILLLLILVTSCTTTVTKYRTKRVPEVKKEKVPVYKTVTKVNYLNISPNLFNNYQKPIELGFLHFEKNGSANYDLIKNFKKKLLSHYGSQDNFLIYDYNLLKNLLEMSTIIPSKQEHLNSLGNNLNIKFVLSGIIHESSFRLKLHRTYDGSLIFNEIFQDSYNSSAIDDALKVFFENKEPSYYTEEIVERYKIEKYTIYKNKRESYKVTEYDVPKTSLLIIGTIIILSAL